MATAIRISSLAIPFPAASRRGGSPASLFLELEFLHRRRRRSTLRLRASPASDVSGGDRVDPHRDSAPVEVIGIGSRKDAVIDFCLGSPSISSSPLRFWTIHLRDSSKVQLQQRSCGTDVVLRNLEFPLSLHPCPPAAILVASAGHGLDHIAAIELLNGVRSAGGLVVAILLKPFSFEGQRRQKEVDDLVNKLQECSHLNIVVETDALLKTEAETLAEALESANNAVFLAANAISTLMSEMHLKFLNTPDGQIMEVKPLEVGKLLESYGEAKVGFGAGYNLKSAITQAVFHCPFLTGGLKDLNGLVIFTLTSACAMAKSDLASTILNFRRLTECTRDIVFSQIYEPDLEPNLIVTTLLIVGCNEKNISPKKSFLAGIALHFPFLSSLLGRDHEKPNGYPSAYSHCKPSDNGAQGYLKRNPKEVEAELPSRELSHESKRCEVESSDTSCESVSENEYPTNEESCNATEKQSNWNIGAGLHIAQIWAKERTVFPGTNKTDKQDIFTLPVGVKSSELRSDCIPCSEYLEYSDDVCSEVRGTADLPTRDALTDAGLEAIKEFYNIGSTLLKGRTMDDSRKRGLLSVRAASMLESERETPKRWTPIMEIHYRGGIYRGRCQGGLPEGKGCITFMDGSFYDGMWHCGKRSGMGAFCYSNGDVFQGSWRDDFMHGKGWFYFHSGDRWFANFWKGKANGEGRFYSKNGSIFFGCFQNGWRHGESLHIDADGSRWSEIWDEGVLISRTQLDDNESETQWISNYF